MTEPMSRSEYEVVKFVAQSSGATLNEARMELMQGLLEAGWTHEVATALLTLFQVLAIDAGIEGPTLDLKLADRYEQTGE
jgi:hypothetical protein